MRRRKKRTSRSPRRLVSTLVVLLAAFGAMAARLITLQAVDAPEYAQMAAEQRERIIQFPARRGALFDRDGEPLAISVDMRTIFADPQLVDDPHDAARRLARVLKVEPEELVPRLQGTWPGDRFEFIARHVEPDVARKVKKLDVPGIYMESEPKRYYPNAKLASHLLGFVDVDGKGLSGVEVLYEDVLRGKPGRMRLEQDPAGRPLPQAEFTYERPQPGRSLFLTIDKDVQYFVEEVLAEAVERHGGEGGTAIVMRPKTGELLAVANVPDFDPNRPGDALDVQRNRAITDMYEPGSAFKIVTIAGALEDGVVSPASAFIVPDSLQVSVETFNDSHPHPTERMTVRDIVKDSSNVGTIKVALRLGEERVDRYVRRFGFGRRTGLGFPGEARGMVLDRKQWSGVTIATVPIGQGISVTPLQMMAAYSTIANRGVRVHPTLVYGSLDDEGHLEPAPAPRTKRIVSKRTARQMTAMLERVVDDGTGVLAQVPGYRIAGKTGTAQKPLPTGGYGNSYVASFAGFAPARNPQVACIVVLDEPRPIWGGHTAAPVFQEIVEFTLRHLGVSPRGNAMEAARRIEDMRSDRLSTRD